nr:hypothetical protein [Spirochaetales bacterium]
MLPYWILFLLPACLAIKHPKPGQTQTLRVLRPWWVAFVLLVLMIGLRHHEGGDWDSDSNMIRVDSDYSLARA